MFENFPGRQSKQTGLPANDDRPNPHGKHKVLLKYRPGEQSVQKDLPKVDDFPNSQSKHALVVVTFEYFPIEQLKHSVLRRVEDLPGGHVRQ